MFISVNPHNAVELTRWQPDSFNILHEKITRANAAFKLWQEVSLAERAKLIIKLADIIEQNQHYWAALITATMGKPITFALKEVVKSASVLRHFANPELLAVKKINSSYADTYEILQPLGVIYAVMPWNYPIWQVIRVLAPNLLLGNAMALAHAPNVHIVALALEQALVTAGFPRGMLVALRPEHQHSKDILAMPAIKGLAFTGSDKVGAILAGYAGSALKPATLECGGSDPYLVLADADLPAAAKIILAMRLNNSGQVCISAKRIIIVQEVYEEFLAIIKSLMQAVEYSDPMQPETTFGPLARADIREAVHKQVIDSIALGADCLLGGEMPSTRGFYYPATLLTDVTPEMPVFFEEVFGPVMCLIRADSDQHAIKLANQHKYGLGAAVFSEDSNKADNIAKKLNVGTCMINAGVSSDPCLPFGGIGRSGFGRELGSDGLRAFANIKIIGR